MISFAYLACLLGALGCMALIDHRWRLVVWADARRAALVLAVGVALFLAWDVAALSHGFYRRGETEVMTGLLLAPDLPVEELFFVLFLCYSTLVLHRAAHVALSWRAARRSAADDPRRDVGVGR